MHHQTQTVCQILLHTSIEHTVSTIQATKRALLSPDFAQFWQEEVIVWKIDSHAASLIRNM